MEEQQKSELVQREGVEEWELQRDFESICRTCAKSSEYNLPIFHGVGLNHELPVKIDKYLPVKVSVEDSLPKVMCLACANTLVGWHSMVTQCLDAEKKLQTMMAVVDTEEETIEESELCADQSNDYSGEIVKESETAINLGVQSVQEDTNVTYEGDPVLQNLTESQIVILSDGSETNKEKYSFQCKVMESNIQKGSEKELDDTNHPLFCMHCGRLFHSEKSLTDHISIVHSEKCIDCDTVFNSAVELKAHLNEKDMCLGKVSCADCPKTYKRKTDLIKHVRLKHSSLTGFHCDLCGKRFNRKVCLEFHRDREHRICEVNIHNTDNEADLSDTYSVNSEDIDRHCGSGLQRNDKENETGIKPYLCSHCNESFTCKSDLLVHEKTVVSLESRRKKKLEEKNFQCYDCGRWYARKPDLARHQRVKHLNVPVSSVRSRTVDQMDANVLKDAEIEVNGNIVYHCSTCGKNIITKRGYIRHYRIHSGERPFTCHVCGKQYRSSTDLSRHLRCVHEGIKNYQCDICNRYFANKGTRNDHRRTHTKERPYICDVCGKSFPTSNSIYVHRRIHTDYFPHQCSSCDKGFRRKQQLIHHMRTHTGEKPHSCEVCGKCFGVKDELSRHKLTHSTEKPYSCPTCGSCFGQKRYLKNHMKTHHSNYVLGL